MRLSKKPDIRFQATALALVVALVLWAGYALFAPIDKINLEVVTFEIKAGQGLKQIAQNLKEADLIRSRNLFIIYVSASGSRATLKAGKYKLSKSLSASKIAQIMIGGFSESNDYQILLAEGFNVWEINKRLAEYGMAEPNTFTKKYLNYEGYLFPDTYRVARPSSENFDLNLISDEVFRKMRNEFETKTSASFSGLSQEHKKQVIIVASMLEKEARLENDMKLVSGIIWKRLENDWHLRIDATVSYGACLKKFTETGEYCDVSQIGVAREIKIDGPYNTYTRLGFPPGPISNPGLKAIRAALNPIDSPYWFYLSARGTGEIIYSKTAEEHAANRLKYLGL